LEHILWPNLVAALKCF